MDIEQRRLEAYIADTEERIDLAMQGYREALEEGLHDRRRHAYLNRADSFVRKLVLAREKLYTMQASQGVA
jgi:hypothetical protein